MFHRAPIYDRGVFFSVIDEVAVTARHGRPILFLQGLSQCWLQWSRQLNSELTREHLLVALDLRGHGLSDKPRDGYSDSKPWADDIHAVIRELNLARPVLSGWSYGPLVFLDYIRHYGKDRIGGLQFGGGVTKPGSERAMAALTPEFLSLVPQFFSTDTEMSVSGLTGLLQLCFLQQPSASEHYLIFDGLQRHTSRTPICWQGRIRELIGGRLAIRPLYGLTKFSTIIAKHSCKHRIPVASAARIGRPQNPALAVADGFLFRSPSLGEEAMR